MCKYAPSTWSGFFFIVNGVGLQQVGRDELVTDSSGRHVAILRRGRIYTFDVLRADGSAVTIDEIKAHLQGIVEADAPVCFTVSLLAFVPCLKRRQIYLCLRHLLTRLAC